MKYFITLIAILICNVSFSQARYVFIDFKDAQKPGIQNEYSYPNKTVNDALEEKLSKMGYKGKESKGYTMYKGVTLPELGNKTYDLYFKVERKSKKDRDNAVVNMLISTGNENFVDTSDSQTISNAKTFLNNLGSSISAYDLQQQVNDQEDAVKKAEKKYKSLQGDLDDLQKKKRRLEQQIDDNLKAQKDQEAEIQKQRQLYDALKARQK